MTMGLSLKQLRKIKKKQELFDEIHGDGAYSKWVHAKKKHRRERSIALIKMAGNLASLGTLFKVKVK